MVTEAHYLGALFYQQVPKDDINNGAVFQIKKHPVTEHSFRLVEMGAFMFVQRERLIMDVPAIALVLVESHFIADMTFCLSFTAVHGKVREAIALIKVGFPHV